jgi:hypothetical protein
MCQHAAPGEVRLTPAAHALLGPLPPARAPGDLREIKGLGHMRTYRAIFPPGDDELDDGGSDSAACCDGGVGSGSGGGGGGGEEETAAEEMEAEEKEEAAAEAAAAAAAELAAEAEAEAAGGDEAEAVETKVARQRRSQPSLTALLALGPARRSDAIDGLFRACAAAAAGDFGSGPPVAAPTPPPGAAEVGAGPCLCPKWARGIWRAGGGAAGVWGEYRRLDGGFRDAAAEAAYAAAAFPGERRAARIGVRAAAVQHAVHFAMYHSVGANAGWGAAPTVHFRDLVAAAANATGGHGGGGGAGGGDGGGSPELQIPLWVAPCWLVFLVALAAVDRAMAHASGPAGLVAAARAQAAAMGTAQFLSLLACGCQPPLISLTVFLSQVLACA